MTLRSRREFDFAVVKLRQIEERYAEAAARPVAAGAETTREWTLLSLKKLIHQFQEEIARFNARARSDRD